MGLGWPQVPLASITARARCSIAVPAISAITTKPVAARPPVLALSTPHRPTATRPPHAPRSVCAPATQQRPPAARGSRKSARPRCSNHRLRERSSLRAQAAPAPRGRCCSATARTTAHDRSPPHVQQPRRRPPAPPRGFPVLPAAPPRPPRQGPRRRRMQAGRRFWLSNSLAVISHLVAGRGLGARDCGSCAALPSATGAVRARDQTTRRGALWTVRSGNRCDNCAAQAPAMQARHGQRSACSI